MSSQEQIKIYLRKLESSLKIDGNTEGTISLMMDGYSFYEELGNKDEKDKNDIKIKVDNWILDVEKWIS